jgi:ABC-type amino acid transport substrate-binding protein
MRCLLLIFLFSQTAFAAPLRIGIHDKPPFAMRDTDGKWVGLGVDLWSAVAEKASLDYELVEVPFERLVPDLEAGRLDAAIGELSISPELEDRIDFSQPFLTTSLGAAVSSRYWRTDWLAAFRDFFSWDLARIFLGIFAALLIASISIWFFERGHPSGHFNKKFLEGVGSGLWFAASTMTSVGYGDKTPCTLAGRIVAIFWMLAGVLILAGFIGVVTSSISEARVRATVMNASDVLKLHNGSLVGGPVQSVLRKEGVRCDGFETAEEGIRAVADGRIESFITDHLTLSYILMHAATPRVRLMSLSMYQFSVAIAFPEGSTLREKTAVPLLEVMASPEWAARLRYWLGAEAALGYQTRAFGQ